MTVRCGTCGAEAIDTPVRRATAMLSAATLNESALRQVKVTYIGVEIEVVVYVFLGTDDDWIAEDTIQLQIDQLNDDFRGINNAKITFRLAATRSIRLPNEDQDFIVRPDGPLRLPHLTMDQSNLNIVIVPKIRDSEDKRILGFAQIPSVWGLARRDCVVISRDVLVGGREPFHLGRTVTHEVGHWLGLLHPFQEGGDGIDDTPEQLKPQFHCPPEATTFMDYADDACMTHFTWGQIAKMRETLGKPRPQN